MKCFFFSTLSHILLIVMEVKCTSILFYSAERKALCQAGGSAGKGHVLCHRD